VRYRGEVDSSDSQFRQFESMAMGYRAMFVLLHTYRIKYGLRTVAQMIRRYAPDSENNTKAYIDSVVQISGIDAGQQIDTTRAEVMVPVVAAMSRIENGVGAVSAEVMAGWRLFEEDYSSSSSWSNT
jgi:hypothetical protein